MRENNCCAFCTGRAASKIKGHPIKSVQICLNSKCPCHTVSPQNSHCENKECSCFILEDDEPCHQAAPNTSKGDIREEFEDVVFSELMEDMKVEIGIEARTGSIMSALNTFLSRLADEIGKGWMDEYSGYGEVERRIINGTIEANQNIIRKYIR